MNESLSNIETDYADARLESLLIEGLSNGDDIPLSPEFWSELTKDAAEILDGRKQSGSMALEPSMIVPHIIPNRRRITH